MELARRRDWPDFFSYSALYVYADLILGGIGSLSIKPRRQRQDLEWAKHLSPGTLASGVTWKIHD